MIHARQIKTFILSILVLTNYNAFAQNWVQRASMPGNAMSSVVTFVIGDYVYSGAGSLRSDFWKYDPLSDSWTQVASMPQIRDEAFGFSIGSYGYVGGGAQAQALSDFYQYDPAQNNWTQKGNLPYRAIGAFGFSIGTKGYYGTGYDGFNYRNQFYEYDPISDLWNLMPFFGGGTRALAAAFVIDSTAYVVAGNSNSFTNRRDCWAYTPGASAWVLKDSLPGPARIQPAAFSVNGRGYVGGGAYGSSWSGAASLFDFYSYDPTTNSWDTLQNFPGYFSRLSRGFSINSVGYFCNGYDGVTTLNELWAYYPAPNSVGQILEKKQITSCILTSGDPDKIIRLYFGDENNAVNIFDISGRKTECIPGTSTSSNLLSGIYWFVSASGNRVIRVLVP